MDLERLQSSFAQVFGELLPALISALVVLFAGYLLAKVVERLMLRLLRRLRLNAMLERGGVMDAVERSGNTVDAQPIRALVRSMIHANSVAIASAIGMDAASTTNVFSRTIPMPGSCHTSANALRSSRPSVIKTEINVDTSG